MIKKLNILQVYDYMELGGAETHIITLSNELRNLGNNVWIMASKGPAQEWIKMNNIPFIEAPLDNPNEQLTCVVKIIESVKKYNIDIIHVHPFNSLIACVLANVVTQIPLVTTLHNIFPQGIIYDFENQFAAFVAVSEEVKSLVVNNGLIPSKVRLIPNTVPMHTPPSKVNFFKNGAIRLSYISRISTEKLPSIKFFLKSVEEIVKELPLEVNLIGQGDKLNEILEITDKINKIVGSKIITVIPGSTNIENNIENSDVVIGVGRVILEAISMGKFALCIGNNNYVGIINKETLMHISKVNFTDRNTASELNFLKLKYDLKKLYNDFDTFYLDLLDTFNLLLENFSTAHSAKEHIEIYNEVIKKFAYTHIIYILEGISIPRYIDTQITYIIGKYSENIHSSYPLDNPKDFKIFISPEFDNPNDLWPIALNSLINNLSSLSPATIIIKIDSRYVPYTKEIVEQIELVLNNNSKVDLPDIMLETKDMDEFDEMLFIYTMNVFIPTNSNQEKLKFKCFLKETEVIEIDHLNSITETLY